MVILLFQLSAYIHCKHFHKSITVSDDEYFILKVWLWFVYLDPLGNPLGMISLRLTDGLISTGWILSRGNIFGFCATGHQHRTYIRDFMVILLFQLSAYIHCKHLPKSITVSDDAYFILNVWLWFVFLDPLGNPLGMISLRLTDGLISTGWILSRGNIFGFCATGHQHRSVQTYAVSHILIER